MIYRIMKYLEPFDQYQPISEALEYHVNNGLNLFNSIYRIPSQAWLDLVNEARNLYEKVLIELSEEDSWLISTNIGEKGIYEGKEVLLDFPMENGDINEAEYHGKNVKLGYPMRGGTKKYHVYVKNPKTGKIKKIAFGDVHGGQTAKVSNPKARASFAARHQCAKKKDRTKAGYWSCRINRYSHIFGKSYPGYW